MSITGALTPIYNLQGGQYGLDHYFHADDALLCMAINHHFENHPEAFGDTRTRMDLRVDVMAWLAMYSIEKGHHRAPVLPKLAEIFKAHSINPFENVRLAFIGGGDYFGCTVFGAGAKPLRDMFGEFLDLQKERGQPLYLSNAGDFIQDGKYDYVVSGNVLNEPCTKDVAGLMKASAILLKQGGIAIHGLNYSPDHYGLIRGPQDEIGQSHIMDFPIYERYCQQVVDAAVLRQDREIAPS